MKISKKTCRDCGLEKELSEFPIAPTNRDGISTRCKKCLSIYQMVNRRRNHPLKKRKHEGYTPGTKEWRKSCYLLSKFGITLDEYTKLLTHQEGKCKICGVSVEHYNKMLSVDHDHNTCLVRGLLCQACNIGLGFFQDDIELLEKAVNYLKDFKKSLGE